MICVGNNVSSFAKAFSTIYISGDGVFSSGRTTIYIWADYNLHLCGLRFTSGRTTIYLSAYYDYTPRRYMEELYFEDE